MQDFIPDWAPLAGYAVGFLILLFLVASWIKVADQWDRAVILRFGRFNRVAGPGLFIKLPFIESICEWVSVQTEVTEIKADKALTIDTVPVTVSTVLYWKVVDPSAASINVDDYQKAIDKTAQVALREAIGSHKFTELLSNRASVDAKIQEVMQRRTHDWGIEVSSVDIRDVQIPEDLQSAMSMEAQAEREKHARVILGQSELDIANSFASAAAVYDASPTALRLRAMNIIYETTRDKGSTVLLPSELLDAFRGLKNAPNL